MIERGRLQPRQYAVPAIYLVASAIGFFGVSPSAFRASTFTNFDLVNVVSMPMLKMALAGVLSFLFFITLLFWFLAGLEEGKRRWRCLMVSLVTQLGLLGVFKYFNFFVDSLTTALNDIGVQTGSLHLNIVLPVGVSFYTFQSLSYTIDIYRKQYQPTDRFFRFRTLRRLFPAIAGRPNRTRPSTSAAAFSSEKAQS